MPAQQALSCEAAAEAKMKPQHCRRPDTGREQLKEERISCRSPLLYGKTCYVIRHEPLYLRLAATGGAYRV